MVIPTLAADFALEECLQSLQGQTCTGFEVVVVDNSGRSLLTRGSLPVALRFPHLRVIENARNLGFGAAINQGIRTSEAEFVAALNDDAIARPGWLASLLAAADRDPRSGMWASQVLLFPDGLIDSAGMCAARDGSSKQRGHRQPPGAYREAGPALLPSGAAALYRRSMLQQIGLFDEAFFLYCEDTDLGLRARWAGWECEYVPEAIVEHRHSHSAGRASPVKAYYVERNRLFTVLKNFPLPLLAVVPFAAVGRYFWHLVAMWQKKGVTHEFRRGGSAWVLAWFILRAHGAALLHLPRLLRQRHAIAEQARIGSAEFRALLRRHSISTKEVAFL